ncbi:MAG: DciA family protein [Vicinamibacterales bacterium]
MIPVRQVMPGALEAILQKAPLTPEKVAFAWRAIVGPAVDRATTIELRDSVLYVRARDAAWRREIERSAGLIRKRLVTFLGDQAVRFIDVTTG